MSFGRDTKSRWSLLFAAYAWGSKNPTHGVNVQPAVDSISHKPLQKRPRRYSINYANYLARGYNCMNVPNIVTKFFSSDYDFSRLQTRVVRNLTGQHCNTKQPLDDKRMIKSLAHRESNNCSYVCGTSLNSNNVLHSSKEKPKHSSFKTTFVVSALLSYNNVLRFQKPTSRRRLWCLRY